MAFISSPRSVAAQTEPSDLRVWVHAPAGRDGKLIAQTLARADVAIEAREGLAGFSPALDRVGALILTVQGITPGVVRQLEAALLTQPSWSSLPLIFLLRPDLSVDDGLYGERVRRLFEQAIVLDLPVAPARLVSVVRFVLESRRRQYEVRDLQRALEATLVRRNASLRTSALDLTRAEFRERERLAHLLHDDIQQLLVAALMHMVPLVDLETRRLTRDAIETVKELMTQAITASRELASELSPAPVGVGGLGDALQRLADQMLVLHRLVVRVRSDETIEIRDATTAAYLFEATRELLFNVVKHANVAHARIDVEQDADELRVTVEDGGLGMSARSATQMASTGGFGLRSVRERLENIGGRMMVSVPPGGGTRITLAVPAPRTPVRSP